MRIEYVFFVLIAVLLAGGALAWSRADKKRKAAAKRSSSSRRSSRHGSSTQSPSRLHDLNSVSELPSMLVASGDPMADAALNLKYGRNAQAIYILKEAFRANPPMMDAGMKLAEILLSSNDIKNYNKVEARFRALTNEEGPFWEALKILRADFLGAPDEYENSTTTYTDFSSTEISNLQGPVTKSSPSSKSAPSRQI